MQLEFVYFGCSNTSFRYRRMHACMHAYVCKEKKNKNNSQKNGGEQKIVFELILKLK